MTSGPATVEVRHATTEDLPAIGRVLGAAFDDDPVINWIVRQDGRRREAIELLFGEVTRHAYVDQGETYITADEGGVAVWRPPGAAEPPGEPIDHVFEEVVGPRGRAHLDAFGAAMREHHPDAPEHFYLSMIGVDPPLQGSGVGSALIRSVLERCDRERIPVYLANTKERNLAFYERHGFAARGRVELPDGGPPMWPMWRAPEP